MILSLASFLNESAVCTNGLSESMILSLASFLNESAV